MEKSWNFVSEIFVGTLSKKITYFGLKFGEVIHSTVK